MPTSPVQSMPAASAASDDGAWAVDAPWDVSVVGGGAAGLMAGIHAGRAAQAAGIPLRIVLLDGARRLGTKILVAGGGRCNVSHDQYHASDYATTGSQRTIQRVLASFPPHAMRAFFAQLGVELKREDSGKLFPVTDRAQTVLDALLTALQQAGCQLHTRCRVDSVHATPAGPFRLCVRRGPHAEPSTLRAHRIILATGGRALPASGSDGHGYTLAAQLGHGLVPTWPALVPLTLDKGQPVGRILTALSGTACLGELRVESSAGKILAREGDWRDTSGEAAYARQILLTHFGLSGPGPMDISRHWRAHAHDGARLRLALLPGGFEAAQQLLLQAAHDRPKAMLRTVLEAWLPTRLAAAWPELVGLAQGADRQPMAQLGRDTRRQLAHALTALDLPVNGDRGYAHAETTAGGVPLAEIDPHTMASQTCPGLHLCGELLDVDGPIGGYNFQWAWASGRLAGLGAAAACIEASSCA